MTIPAEKKPRNPMWAALNDPEALHLPDVACKSNLDAALAYADAGWFVLPTDPEDIKSPGSVVGGKWPEKSSRDAARIRRWWSVNPHYGIALHCGRSGAGVFDLDVSDLGALRIFGRDDLADALLTAGAIQGTRSDGERGHYIFRLPDDGKEYGNSAGAFTIFGEFRGKNGVIIAAPTPHPDAESKGGEYRQVRTGPVGPMPEALRDCLSEAGESNDSLTDAELESFIDAHTGGGCGRDDCAHSVDGPVTNYNAKADEGASRYETLVAVAPWALSEAAAGCYSAREVVERLRRAYESRFGPEDGDRLGRVPGEFLRVMRWGAAQADASRAHRNDDSLTAGEQEAFWSARPELAQLRQFARARCVGPWSVLGAVMARAIAAIPPHVVLPPVVGSAASLNLFVALVAPSGGGKGASESVAGDFLESATEVWVATPGSGEGILKQYAYVQKAAKGQPPRQVNLRNSVLLTVGEVDSLNALAGRSGSTLMPELRKAWMGERLGFGWATAEKAVVVMEHRYRMAMVVGVQPGRGGGLLNDSDGGTPQRFVWLPTTDPDAPDVPPVEPVPLRLPGWPAPPNRAVQEEGKPTLKFGPDVDQYQLNMPPVRSQFHMIALPPSVVETIRSEQLAKLRGETTRANDLDSHAMLARLKIAAALMWLNGRTDKVSEEDWDLAGVVMAMSKATRRSVQSELRTKAEVASRQRGRQDAEREVAKEDVVREKRAAKLVEKVRAKLREENDQSRSALKKRFQNSDRALVDEVIDLLARTGDLELRHIEYKGNPGQVLHLKEGQ